MITFLVLYSLRVHCPCSPASFLAELIAAFIAKRTLIDNRIGGSPVAKSLIQVIIFEWLCHTF